MTLQQKRRALAEACPGIFTIGKNSGMVRWKDTGEDVTEREWLYAVHLAEGTLEQHYQVVEYGIEVLKAIECTEKISVEGEPNWGKLIHATESQRIDAFLKVKGLWKE